MEETLLSVRDLSVSVGDKPLLHHIDLDIQPGQTHVLMGPNGAGKSTLGKALMGDPRYRVTGGSITLNGEDLTEKSADQRAKAGLFLSFQEPLEVPGLTVQDFLRTVLYQRTGKPIRFLDFRRDLAQAMELLQMDPSYAQRELNVGFSGGEKKKCEILQLLLLRPKLAILDETDSGLDVDAVRLVSEGVRHYQQEQGGALLVVTHSTRILDALTVDRTHVMVDGRLVKSGDRFLVGEIDRSGYTPFLPAQEGERV